VETSTPDVDHGDFFGVGGVEGSQLRVWSSHWKGPKRRPQSGPLTDFFSQLTSCKPSATPVETSAPDVDFGDFFGVGGVAGMRSNPQSGNESPHWTTSGSFC